MSFITSFALILPILSNIRFLGQQETDRAACEPDDVFKLLKLQLEISFNLSVQPLRKTGKSFFEF
jgi:hypothetical protein